MQTVFLAKLRQNSTRETFARPLSAPFALSHLSSRAAACDAVWRARRRDELWRQSR